jgi:hypothetical protein
MGTGPVRAHSKQERTVPRSANRVVSLCCALLALSSVRAAAAVQAIPARQGLTAFRPQHGAGYAPFVQKRVPEELEEDPARGPGIRVNGLGELDPAGEDDLVEVIVSREVDATLVLERSGPQLSVWRTRDRRPGMELPFVGARSAPLPFGRESRLTLWIEWRGAGGVAALVLRALEPDLALDRLLFHAFTGLVVALGGEGQTPQLPPDPNHGTFVVGQALYEQGYDVLMSDEDEVHADGSGSVYDEVVNAVQHRSVTQLAIFGYSHGGGSTHDLCERLDALRAGIGTFTIAFTSYVDGVENDSDIDVDMELRRPPASAFHADQFQRGSFADFFLDGGPVPNSAPPPSGLDVETTPWGSGATHFVVDDFTQVRDFILMNLELRVSR